MLGGSEFEPEVIDSTGVTLDVLDLREEASFEYVFDSRDNWRHRCEIRSVDVDPAEDFGLLPDTPVPIWGWGGFRTSTAASTNPSSEGSAPSGRNVAV